MNLACKHLEIKTYKSGEMSGSTGKETYYDCIKDYKELGSLKSCTYACDGKSIKECLNFEKK